MDEATIGLDHLDLVLTHLCCPASFFCCRQQCVVAAGFWQSMPAMLNGCCEVFGLAAVPPVHSPRRDRHALLHTRSASARVESLWQNVSAQNLHVILDFEDLHLMWGTIVGKYTSKQKLLY